MKPQVEIEWTMLDRSADALPAKVVRAVHHEGKVFVTFEGLNPEYRAEFTGVIGLRLTHDEQCIESAYSLKLASGLTSTPYTLRGKFQDANFKEFTGFWDEEGQTYELSITGLSTVPF